MRTPIRRISSRFCARAAIGHAAKPTTTPIKSRRLIVVPEAQETTSYRLKLVLRRGTGTRAVYAHECPLWVKSRHVQCNRPCPLYPRKRPRKRTSEPARVSPSTHQLRQLGDIRRDPPRLVTGEASVQCYCGMISWNTV